MASPADGRRRRILLADNDQRRRRHARIGGAEVHVADRLDSRRCSPHGWWRRTCPVMRSITCGARSRKSLVNQRSMLGPTSSVEALLAHELDAVVPRRLVGVIEIGVGEDQFLEAIRRVGAQPLAVHAAHREAAPIGFFDLERVEDRDDVAPETVEAVRALGRAGLAVAAAVVADEAEVLGEFAAPGRPTCADWCRANSTASAPARSRCP